eukprot:2006601-Lingulodinium_polyedra.AAC.1
MATRLVHTSLEDADAAARNAVMIPALNRQRRDENALAADVGTVKHLLITEKHAGQSGGWAADPTNN